MARIALGITLALLLATCYFGFETKSKVGDLSDQLNGAKSQLASANQEAAKAKADEKTAKDALSGAKSDAESAKADLATAQSSLTDANGKIASLTDENTKLKAQVANAGPNKGPDIAPAGPTQADMDKVTAQLKDAEAHVAELTQVKDTLSGKVKDIQSRTDDLQKIVDHYHNISLKNGLEGEVLAVNQGWSFVVLSIGDHQGAVANAELILKRGDSQIGKVRITSVEPSTSVADIVPGSLARGVRVQPGDRVIFPGS